MSLLGLVRTDGLDYIKNTGIELQVKFPKGVATFLMTEVYPELEIGHQAYLMTTGPGSEVDESVLVDALAKLDLGKFVEIENGVPDIVLPGDISFWRTESQLRIFVETCLLCGISSAQVTEDLRTVWGLDVDVTDVEAFKVLFADPIFNRGKSWASYEQCIDPGEALFKRRLLRSHHDFVRYKLGVPVVLETSKVLNRLISDAYYTEQTIQHEAEGDPYLSDGLLKRLKLERDTVFKALDRRIKLQQYEHEKGSSGGSDIVRATLERLELQYKDSSNYNKESPLLSELNGVPDEQEPDNS